MLKKIVIVAGEESGDRYAGMLSEKLKINFSGIEIYSFAGPVCAKFSTQKINLLEYAVSGLVEVITHLKGLFKIFSETIAEIKHINPDLIILIDFPDFNLRLAKKLNNRFTIFYYVSPQIWAWRKRRINLIRRYVKEMIVLFKFEQDFYEKENVKALYFGHPLLEIIPPIKTTKKKIISLLPGSRKNEIKKHLPIMIKAKELLEKDLPGYSFRIIRPPTLNEDLYKTYDNKTELTIQSYQALAESEFIIACSGTATVEIAILAIPYLIIYKVNPISWFLLRWLIKIKFAGMVNILNAKEIVKELLQDKATPQNIKKETLSYLNNNEKLNSLRQDLSLTRKILSPYGASENFANYIGKFLNLKQN
ncbi:MAG: lipid-A-disaccharide synthase [Candidatus Omnitrophica bacterium]|nr:lipid-A-disaccharide synthase [Candidatus Omnitrophota bacterium]